VKRIGLDATAVSPSGKGLARVQVGTVRALAALGRYELVAYVAQGVDLPTSTRIVRRRPALLWEHIGLARAARETDAVLTWTDRLPLLAGGSFVVWLFELPTHRIEQNRRTSAGPYQRASDLITAASWRSSLRRAAYVLAASEATAEELRAELPGLKVRVLYPGLDERFAPGPGRGDRYVLHVASSDPRDNFDGVFDSVARANRRLREPVRLLVAGSAPDRRGGEAEFLGRVSDDELIALYRGAAAYVDASLYEGFGYQPLEAMACGAPVIASDTSAVAEVVGDSGLLCEPQDADARASAIARVLEEPGLAQTLRRRGLERARQFSWERTARALAGVLDEVVR
jgi:glycosyltransferase involved in cell wall biosynthesis